MKKNFNCVFWTTTLVFVGGVAQPGWGILPQPDALFYGTVRIDDQVVTDNMTVIARVNGVEEPVGTYVYGECVPNGAGGVCPPADRYLLRIRLESLADNPSQSPSLDAAQVGQTVQIFLLPDGGSEMLAASPPISDRGPAQELDLEPAGPLGDFPLFEAASEWYGDPDPLLPPELLQLLETLNNP